VRLSSLELSDPALATSGSIESSTVIFSLTGTVDDKSRLKLQALLEILHGEARRLAARQVVVDFRRLEFMNSSGLKTLVTWISEIQSLSGIERYSVRFITNPDWHWQRRSLHAVQTIASDLVSIEATSK
jgi:hypothetical protein